MSRFPRALWKPVPSFGYPIGTHGQLRANACRKAFLHDAQGWAHGALARFENPANKGSAHIIINLDGPPWQFIDFDDAAWHAGGDLPGLGEFANLVSWGLEFEGGYPTPKPITDYQVDVAIDLCRWLAFEYRFQWQAIRRSDLWEHREVYATACPSNRIRWPEIIAGIKGGPMAADLEDLKAQIVQTQLALDMQRNATHAQFLNVNRKWGILLAAARMTAAALTDDRATYAASIDYAIEQLKAWPPPK